MPIKTLSMALLIMVRHLRQRSILVQLWQHRGHPPPLVVISDAFIVYALDSKNLSLDMVNLRGIYGHL